MKTIEGIYSSATIFTTDNKETGIDPYAIAQIQMLCDNEASKGSKIRIMPDVHPGKVGTIGLTMTVGRRILPNLIGIDIGCGITLAAIRGKNIEFQKLDTVIKDRIPAGFSLRKTPHLMAEEFDFSRLYCHKFIRQEKAMLSMGTLGGGNHFIELGKIDSGQLYLTVHSGSRHLGKEVTEYYLKEGQKALKAQGIAVPYELTWLEGILKEQYLHDLTIIQEFAAKNREIILMEIAKGMKWKITDTFSCIHNYVDNASGTLPLLRKGAISASKGETVIIPIHMRDGILLGYGLGNEDWNYSAPHGAGRIFKREEVSSHFTVSQFRKEMKGIYSSCISKDTLDEAPFAYRNLEEISAAIKDTVTITTMIRPVYNYKSGH